MDSLTTDERLQVSAAITALLDAGYFDRAACAIIARAVPRPARAPWLSLTFRGRSRDGGTVAAGIGRMRLEDGRARSLQTRSTEVAVGQYRLSRSGRSIFVRDFMHASDPQPKPCLELVVDRQGEPSALYYRAPKVLSLRLPLPGQRVVISVVVFDRRLAPEQPPQK